MYTHTRVTFVMTCGKRLEPTLARVLYFIGRYSHNEGGQPLNPLKKRSSWSRNDYHVADNRHETTLAVSQYIASGLVYRVLLLDREG